jgi:CcmD family protein
MLRARRLIAAMLLAIAVTAAAPVQAQPPQVTDPAQQGFVPADKLPQQEQLPATPLVAGAYAFVWVVIFVYLWSIWRRLNTVERELQAVSKRVTSGGR